MMKRTSTTEFVAENLPGFENLSLQEKTHTAAFRRLYYHFYSNSNASRAERIISELSNLILCKIASERNGGKAILDEFVKGSGKANEMLIPLLIEAFPHVIVKDEKFTLEDDILRFGLKELDSLSFQSTPAHILGEAFQALMGPRLRGEKGQFFTPRSLVRAMVAILQPPIDAKIVDPACGTGGFLVETHAFQLKNCCGLQKDQFGLLIGIDKDHDLFRLTDAILEATAPERSRVYNLNSLDIDALSKLQANISPIDADFILTNPPFGAKIKVTDKFILNQYRLGYKRDAQDPQILFLELCIRLLKPGGQLGIVLPEGVFGNSGLAYVWDFVRENGEITALLDCPRTTFQPGTDIKTNVLFFKKNQSAPAPLQSAKYVWTSVALACGHDRRGKSTKTSDEPYQDDFPEIGDSFAKREAQTTPWQKITITNPYYLVPRYYDTSPTDELIKEARRLGAELLSIGQMIKNGYITIRKGHEVGAEAYGTGEIPFIRTSDISNFEVSIDSTRSVSIEVYEQYADQQKLAPGDILLVCDGRYRIGRTAILHEHNYRSIVQSHLRIISVTKKSPVSAIELLYLLSLPMIQHQMRNLVFIQSTLGALGGRLHEVLLPLPGQTKEWQKTTNEFKTAIEGRATLLKKLHEFEHPGYEL